MNIYDTLKEFNNELSFRSKATTLFDVMDKVMILEQILNFHNIVSINHRINSQLDVDDVIFFDYCKFSSVLDYEHLSNDKKVRAMIKEISNKIMKKFSKYINRRGLKPEALNGHPYKLERKIPY